ncbi:hypothetical protein [Marinobacter sp.]|uniref:hypothetical protein n=1 Tax=Marinobacter TaxID=2742 RepID=UPI003264784B
MEVSFEFRHCTGFVPGFHRPQSIKVPCTDCTNLGTNILGPSGKGLDTTLSNLVGRVAFEVALRYPGIPGYQPDGQSACHRAWQYRGDRSGAICAYLADQFSDRKLAPPSQSPERGAYYRWLFFMAGPFEMAGRALAYGWKIDSSNVQVAGCR